MSPFGKRSGDEPILHQSSNSVRRLSCQTVPKSNTGVRGLGCNSDKQGEGDVECDADHRKRDRDSPGQNCAYIPPGNHVDEYYRLATFAKFPSNVPINIPDMAAAGFYYTGFKDRVKCFSCGVSVENWVLGDDGLDKKLHLSNCRLMAGQDHLNRPHHTLIFRNAWRKCVGLPLIITRTNNITTSHRRNVNAASPPTQSENTLTSNRGSRSPADNITSNMARFQVNEATHPPVRIANIDDQQHKALLLRLNLRSEDDRRKTFEKWPSYPAPYLPSQLAKDGFFYLGNTDRTQCFSCSGILRNWASTDNVHEQHRIHLPACRIARGLETGNLPMTENQRQVADESDRIRIEELLSAGRSGEPPNPTQEQQRYLATYFPCSQPTNAHMESLQARVASFDTRWPATVNASVEHLARAGFYYLGESDRTKCFYCNGGLQNWDHDDEPWTEHAKWFPGCEYVIRRKGVEFVRRLKEAHPNLNRPYIRNSVSFDIPPGV